MDEIIKFLKSMGLGDQEIQKVLRETPVNPEGLTGTNVATGVFTKTNPKSKEFVKDFPLVVERIGNPFEVNYYKGKSREETIRMAEDNVKFLENEIKKLADQLLNKNLQLSEQQRINLAKNLATKRKIEKDLEDFKTRPEAPVVDIKTGETVADVERLKEKSGLTAPPTTDIGRIDLRNKQMLQKAEEFYKSQDEFQKEEVARQALIAKQYEGKGYAGGVFGPSGMYRAVARSFLLDQNAKGKIKLTDDVINNLKDRNYISGGQPLLYPDPIRIMRLHYGDDVFEKIPLDKIKTGAESEIIGEMSKININPIKVEAPATPGGYMTPGEIKANIEELENIEKMIKRREFRFADMTDQEIKNELEHYGSQKNAFEVAFGYDHPKEYEEYLKSIERKDPKKFAKGGSVESLGLDYLTGVGRNYPGRSNFEKGTIPKMIQFFIDKLVDEKNFNRKLLEKTNPKLIKEMYIEKFGKLPSAEEIKEIVNKQLQGKYSMESINKKTGEVTTPKEPVTTAEKVQRYDQDMVKAADEIFPNYDDPKIAADQIAESYAQIKLGKNYDDLTSQEQNKIYSQAYDYVMDYNRGVVKSTAPVASKGISLEEEMNMVLNRYDKSMFIKDAQGMVDVTNPENVQKMALLLKRDYPDLYKRLEAQMLEETPMAPTLQEFKKTSPKTYGEFSKKTSRMEELLNFRSGQETFETFDLETYNYLNSKEIGKLLNQLKNPYKILDEEKNLVRTGFTRENFEGTGLKNFEDINFKVDKNQLETYLDDLYNKKQIDEAQTELGDLKDMGREPNAFGGRAGYAEGSDEMGPSPIYQKEYVPSITLDSHDKAPGNMDKYPIKVGNLELGIMGAMSSGKSTPNPYVKINTANRDFTARGKYNVPDTGISLLGDIGDVRNRANVNINVPQYNYKENIKDVMRLNPYSVGIEYAPDQNRNINLRYDDQGNVTLRGEARFAKGGLGYLVGE